MHRSVTKNLLPYLAEAPEKEILHLGEDYLELALLEFAKHVLALEAILQAPEPVVWERQRPNPG